MHGPITARVRRVAAEATQGARPWPRPHRRSRPRQPAWATPTAVGASRTTGAQSAVRTTSGQPGDVGDRGVGLVRRRAHRAWRPTTTSAPCTWCSHVHGRAGTPRGQRWPSPSAGEVAGEVEVAGREQQVSPHAPRRYLRKRGDVEVVVVLVVARRRRRRRRPCRDEIAVAGSAARPGPAAPAPPPSAPTGRSRRR